MQAGTPDVIRKAFDATVDAEETPVDTGANLSRIIAVLIAGALSAKTGHHHIVTARFLRDKNKPLDHSRPNGTRVFCVYDLLNIFEGDVWVDESRRVLQRDGSEWKRLTKDTDLLALPRQPFGNRPPVHVGEEEDIGVDNELEAISKCRQLAENASHYALKDVELSTEALIEEMRASRKKYS
jgi:hypothetical protein